MSHPIWSIVLVAGLVSWITFTLVMIFKVFPERDTFIPQAALKWGVCVIVSFVIWIAGLLNA